MTEAAAIAKIRCVMVWLCFGLALAAHGQEPAIDAPLPGVSFAEPILVEETDDFRRWTLDFASAAPTPFPENSKVRVHLWTPTSSEGAAPVALLLHFWGASDLQLESGIARRLAQRGVATVAMELPFHLSRTPEGQRSGEFMVRPDVPALIANTRQSVWDVRRTLDWIETRSELDSTRIGIGGTSLGAIVAALAYGVEDRLDHALFLLGGADVAHLLWNSSRVVAARDELRSQGWTEDSLREALVEIEPSAYLEGKADAFVISGRYDTVVPRESSEALIDALGEPETLWLDTGHYGAALVESALARLITRFFVAKHAGEPFEAPGRLYAPTLRLGLTYNPATRLQVGLGLDLWRSGDSAEAFATALLTPRGLQGFIGYRLSRELAIGVSVSPRETTVGAMWSVVL